MTADAETFAPAKINLTLHVTGQRADGYHMLDSLVVFADVGDRVFLTLGAQTGFSASGPFAKDVPADNSVLHALSWYAPDRHAEIRLEKNLPASSGIGGGSSDAAATIRGLAGLFDRPLPDAATTAALGADVPVCLRARPARMSGIGDILNDIPDLPPLHLVLMNPGIAISTPRVFQALSCKDNAPMPDRLPDWATARALTDWLATQRNDLEGPARVQCPAIGVALSRLAATEGCLIARMSGSGATCFGLYPTRTEAENAAGSLSRLHPDWWIKPASTWQIPC